MSAGTFEFAPGIFLDVRRAVFFEESSILALADLHFGYCEALRADGQMLPSQPDDTEARLHALLDAYQPAKLLLLGDIVHAALQSTGFAESVRAFFAKLEARCSLFPIQGNHDRRLGRLLGRELLREYREKSHWFAHGDSASLGAQQIAAAQAIGGVVWIGHEHPFVRISDGVAHYARVPCFLRSGSVMVLPAFSAWAAGSEITHGPHLSPYLKGVCEVFAILAGRILPIPRSALGKFF